MKFSAVILILLCSWAAFGAPKDLAGYVILSGGLTDIQDGAYVEGSMQKGGIQPDYRIDLNEEPLKSLLAQSKDIGLQNIPSWDKIGMIVELVNSDFFRYTNYNNPSYRRLLKKYREQKKDIPLNEYLICGAGVCREHALALHFALKAAGIPNKHAYAKIYRASRFDNYEITEDHAFTIVKDHGVDWVVDAYYWGFNGFRLKDLLSPEGITETSPAAPIAVPGPGTRRIIEINAFPKIYNPKSFNRCSAVFS